MPIAAYARHMCCNHLCAPQPPLSGPELSAQFQHIGGARPGDTRQALRGDLHSATTLAPTWRRSWDHNQRAVFEHREGSPGHRGRRSRAGTAQCSLPPRPTPLTTELRDPILGDSKSTSPLHRPLSRGFQSTRLHLLVGVNSIFLNDQIPGQN